MLSKRENELIVDAITLTNIAYDMRINQLTDQIEQLEARIEKLEQK